MKSLICRGTLYLSLIFFHTAVIAENIKQEYNVKVLHSYHQGLEWTDSISSGILSVFNQRYDVNLFFDYLHAKTNPEHKYKDSYINSQKEKAQHTPADVIIVSDNAAFNLMQKHGEELYPGVPVVFCGVNNLQREQLVNYPHFIGIGERADHEGTIDAIRQTFPLRNKILVINDNSITGRAIRSELSKVLPKYEGSLSFEYVSDFTLESLKQKVSKLDDSYAIYLLVINRDKNGKFISYRNGIKSIHSVSNVPIFGSWDFYQGKGLFGGKIISGFKQGESAALIANDILNNKESVFKEKQLRYLPSTYVFDYNEVVKYPKLRRQLPPHSLVINKPQQEHLVRKILLAVSIVFFFAIIILVLLIKHKKSREIQLERMVHLRTLRLKSSNTRLGELVEKRDRFITILGHDLRNSMNNMMTSSFLLSIDEDESECEQSQPTRNKLKQIVNQTHGLLEDLLYWGMRQLKDSQEAVYTKIDVVDLIQSVVDRYKINSANIAFKLDIEPDIKFITDSEICQFIIRNIVQNAIKYSNRDGVVRISAFVEYETLNIEITDYGKGMTSDIVQSIYAKTPIKKPGIDAKLSSGLGLWCALDYLELLQGKIKIQSEPGKGSTFRIQLPLDGDNQKIIL